MLRYRQIFLHILVIVPLENNQEQPLDEVEAAEEGDEEEPEPEEDEDLLIEQVNGKHALHGPSLNVLELTDAEVTEGHSRKPGAFPHTLPTLQHFNVLKSIQVVVGRHECI